MSDVKDILGVARPESGPAKLEDIISPKKGRRGVQKRAKKPGTFLIYSTN